MNNNISFNENNLQNFQPILKSFILSYINNFDTLNNSNNHTLSTWLFNELKQHIPNKNDTEILAYADEIISAINISEEKKYNLQNAISNSRSRDYWFAYDIQQTTEQQNYSDDEKQQLYTNLQQGFNDANNDFVNIFQKQSELSQASNAQNATSDYLNNLDYIVQQNNSAFQNTIITKRYRK